MPRVAKFMCTIRIFLTFFSNVWRVHACLLSCRTPIKEKAKKRRNCAFVHRLGQVKRKSQPPIRDCATFGTFEKLWMQGNGGLENGVENVLSGTSEFLIWRHRSGKRHHLIHHNRLRSLTFPANLGIQCAHCRCCCTTSPCLDLRLHPTL